MRLYFFMFSFLLLRPCVKFSWTDTGRLIYSEPVFLWWGLAMTTRAQIRPNFRAKLLLVFWYKSSKLKTEIHKTAPKLHCTVLPTLNLRRFSLRNKYSLPSRAFILLFFDVLSYTYSIQETCDFHYAIRVWSSKQHGPL